MHFIGKYFYYLHSFWIAIIGFENPLPIVWIIIRRRSTKPFTVRLRRSGYSFRVRSAMDIWSIKETFLNRFYERHGFKIHVGWTVIDVGAGVGDFTLFVAQVNETRILAFEPHPESFVLLSDNLRLNGISNVEAYSETVSSEEGIHHLGITDGEPLKTRSHREPFANDANQIQVRSRSFSEIFNSHQLESCDLLKMDCEGCEYDILMYSDVETLLKIKRIVLEYHDNLTPHRHEELQDFLIGQGFRVHVFDNPVHKNLGFMRAER